MTERIQLLRTKLLPPRAPTIFLARPRLIEKLAQSADYPCSIVCAPAGYGKTSLLASWFQQQQEQPGDELFGWLSVEARDDEPYRFLRYLVAALETAAPSLNQRLLAEDGGDSQHLLIEWINALLHFDANLSLVIDDLHHLQDPQVQAVLATLLTHQPPNLRLILGSRTRPNWLPLDQWLLSGDLLELNDYDLRLSADECSEFSRLLGLSSEEGETSVHQGWMMGLRMQAIAKATGEPQRANESYFATILQQLEPDQQRALLECAFLDQFNDGLCQTVSANDTFRLWVLYQQGLFLTPLKDAGLSTDDKPEWFRPHPLFHEYLRQQALSEFDTKHLDSCRHRAAMWFIKHHQETSALDLLDGIADPLLVAELLEEMALPMLRKGNFLSITPYLDKIEAYTRVSAQLRIAQSVSLTITGQEEDALDILNQLESDPDNTESSLLLSAQLRMSRAGIALRQHRSAQVKSLQFNAVQRALPLPSYIKSSITFNHGLAQWMSLSAEHAVEELGKALRHAWRSEIPGQLAQAATGLIQALLATGRSREALDHVERFEHQLEERDWKLLPVMTQFYFAQVELYHLIRDRERETGALKNVIDSGIASENAPFQALAWLAKVQQSWLQNRVSSAREALYEADSLCRHISLPPTLAPAPLLLANVAMLIGENSYAMDQLRRFEHWQEPSPLDQCLLNYLYAALYSSQLSPQQGLDSLLKEGLLPDINHSLLYTRYALLAAKYAITLRDQQFAKELIEKVLPIIGYTGWTGLIEDAGQDIVIQLQNLSDQDDGANSILRALDSRNRDKTTPTELFEALNSREQQILGLIADGYSNKEISEQVHLSINTVKTHLKNLYLKLQVNSRVQAVKKGEALELI